MRRVGLLAVICSLALVVLAPAGSGASGGLQGLVRTRDFVVPAGTTRLVTGNLWVRASGKIEILGTLLVSPGALLSLHASGLLLVGRAGRIVPAPAVDRDLLDNAKPPPPPSGWSEPDYYCYKSKGRCLVNEISFTDDFEGHNVVINGKIFAGPMLPQNGKPTEKPTSPVPRWGVSVTTPEDGEVWVTGSIVAGTGMNGAELRPAGTGGQVKLGGFLGPDAKVTVASTAVVQAGDGGRGVSDQTGKHVSGSTSCLVPTKGPHFIVPNRSTLVLTGTDGGDGGALRIWSRDISVQSDQVTPGAGGNGGNVQSLYGRIKAPDGTTGESGWNIDATSGSGGAGGGIDLRYSKTYSGGTLRPGRGGDAGSVNVAAGDGAPHCDGGQTEVHLGSPGAAGTDSTDTGTKLPPKGKPKPGSITLEGGGNGGPSTDAKHGGGNGGGVLIKDPSGAVGTFQIERYGDGGVGFDGCKVKPVTAGTDGGNGAELGPAGLPFTATDSFNGENAGDGNPPGARPGGHQRPEPIGKFVNSFGSGSFGKQCPGT
ncbi:MAG: hypothetical protein JO017_09640, partial [Actinobacteria bacterium]|nr:hypothetical protein [Actinomycetota bacterium]